MNDTFPAHILNTCAIICHIKAQPVAVQAGGFDQTIHPQDPGAVVYIVPLPFTALVFLFVSCSFVGVVMSSSLSWFSCYFSPCRGIDGFYFWHVFTFCLRAPSSSASTAKSINSSRSVRQLTGASTTACYGWGGSCLECQCQKKVLQLWGSSSLINTYQHTIQASPHFTTACNVSSRKSSPASLPT